MKGIVQKFLKKCLSERENLILLIIFLLALDYLRGFAFLISRTTEEEEGQIIQGKRGWMFREIIRCNYVRTNFGIYCLFCKYLTSSKYLFYELIVANLFLYFSI